MCLVGSHGVLDPSHVVADLGVDTRFALHGTAIAPGDNALELSIADHRATRVTLNKREKPFRTFSNTQIGKGLKNVPPLY